MFKRGIGHVEAILSFLLFIGFVFFALYFFSPVGNTNIIDSSLQYTLNKLIQNNSVEMLSFSVKINRNNIQNGQRSIAVEFPPEVMNLPSNYKARAETYEGKYLPTTRTGNMVYFDIGTEDFAIIKFCEDFPENTPASESPQWNQSAYTLASSSSKQIISEKKILQMNNSYYSDYDQLKSQFDIPGQVTFGYNIKIENYVISGPKNIPVGVDVYSTLLRKELLKKDGNSLFGEVSVQIW
ncbi:MAG TPA: hypothetical protein VHA12_02960 [Candidatus Nanoarchaeia archaeon]|nr:hypothetical protein [Candidatus Nanoarchaeia archaeon]